MTYRQLQAYASDSVPDQLTFLQPWGVDFAHPSGRDHSHGKTQYIPGKQVLVRSWLILIQCSKWNYKMKIYFIEKATWFTTDSYNQVGFYSNSRRGYCIKSIDLFEPFWTINIRQQVKWVQAYMARNMCKVFSLVPSKKNSHQRKLKQTKSLTKIDQNTNFSKMPSAKWLFFWITVDLVIQKLKSKHLVFLSLFWWEFFFEGTRDYILHIFRA